MANVKTRLRAPKSKTNKRGRGRKKSLTGPNNASDSTRADSDNDVMKSPGCMKFLRSHGKVPFLHNNGCITKDKYSIKKQTKTPNKSVKTNKHKLPKSNGRINKDKLHIATLGLRSRKIIKNTNMKLIKNILKSELMGRKRKSRRQPKEPVVVIEKPVQVINNNNEFGIIDQNESSQDAVEITKKNDTVKKTKVSNKKLKGIRKRATLKKNNLGKKNKSKGKSASKTKQVTLSNGLVLTLTLFQCDYCNKMFSSKSSLRRHIYGHLNIKPHACKKCSKKFHYKMHLTKHIENHHTEKPFLCHICNKNFKLEENLSLHLNSHVKNENAYKCIYCEKKFSYNLLLIQHEKQHLVTGRYQCTICSMSYDCRNRLSSHMKSHLKIKDYICQQCGKEFLRLNSMRRHVQICHGGHRIQCPICKKKLKGHLSEHIRVHKQARPHECDLCGQRFTQSTQLNVHKRCHTGARPYTCRICKSCFTHSNALMLHIRRHTGEKPFPCAMCPMSFSQSPHMKAHMKKIHGKVNPFKCPKCEQFFKLKSQVDSHARACTAGERELSFEESLRAAAQCDEVEVEPAMSLTRMRFLLALLLTMIATKDKLKFLGFNKRLIDDLLVESLEAMGQEPCKDESLQPYKRLKTNIHMLLMGTIPKQEMEKFQKENKTTEDLLELLTDDKTKCD